MITILNIASLVLGLASWFMPVISIILYKYKDRDIGIGSFILSLSTCLISLFFQIIQTNHLVNIEDWSAILDTYRAVTYSAVILVITTITLNILTYNFYRKVRTSETRMREVT